MDIFQNKQIGNIPSPNTQKNILGRIFLSILMVVIIGASISFLWSPPSEFPQNKIFEIQQGATLGEISAFLKQERLIRSRFVFEFCVISFRGDKGALSGKYLVKEPLGPCALARRIVGGISGIPAVRITIPEGSSAKEIAKIIQKNIQSFNAQSFLTLAQKKEGYLFPDTYFFNIDVNPEIIVATLVQNFEKKVKTLEPLFLSSGRTESDVVIMASLIEKEAKTPEDQRIVSGILWKRIDIKMPLQVDAPFYYLFGKESSEITKNDLSMKSGYNTYRNLGLPVGAIGNPGISALRAALDPAPSPYLFYLSDKDGIIHYAKDFEEHKKNRNFFKI